MKKFFLLMVGIMMSLPMVADNAKFYVLTCSPGDEAYALYGHTGLRYCNEEKDIDIVFNYGYFDFDSPNFAWRFILGETDYMVGAVPHRLFCQEYINRGSAVFGQMLELTPEQEDELCRLLVENCRPQNRIYRYNYFYNNCTTKIRDMIALVADSVVYDAPAQYPTFRHALNAMLGEHPWFAFGINLLLGADIDRPATAYDLHFIPQNYMDALDSCYVINANGEKYHLVEPKFVVIPESENNATVNAGNNNFTPFNVALLLLVATFIIMSCEVRKKRTFWAFDVVIMTLQGLSGCLLMFLALFSQHPAVGNNWLLLLFNPLALVLMPIYICRIRKHKSLAIAWLQVVMALLFFISAVLQLQVYPLPIYFCAVALLVRSLFLIYKDNICELSRF